MSSARRKKVLVAMSGGVDSSVAALLLKQQGLDVVGCFMRLGSEEETTTPESECALPVVTPANHHQGCCSLNDAADARLVAAMLDVPFYVLNFKRDFGRIIDYFVAEYDAGRTPNPCVRCNDWLKFGKLHDYARSIDADFVATGHYARVDHRGDEPRLLRGLDTAKDQSYVLFGTPRARLREMLLPVGELSKPEVRRIAQESGLPVFDKPDSQEICFVPDNDYAALIRRRSPESLKPGDIVDDAGRVLGQHEGQQHFTIGQRRGLGVAAGEPIYVVSKDAATNTVVVGPRDRLLSEGLDAAETNWLVPPPMSPRRCTVRIRYNSQPVPAHVTSTGDTTLTVRFDEPQAAVSPGQAVVCYDGDEVLGGGWIATAIARYS